MTYCIGINVNEGMVFASDSRTNAGLDDINTYTKMFNYAVGDRNLVIVTSGNLATSQAVFSSIKKDLEDYIRALNQQDKDKEFKEIRDTFQNYINTEVSPRELSDFPR